MTLPRRVEMVLVLRRYSSADGATWCYAFQIELERKEFLKHIEQFNPKTDRAQLESKSDVVQALGYNEEWKAFFAKLHEKGVSVNVLTKCSCSYGHEGYCGKQDTELAAQARTRLENFRKLEDSPDVVLVISDGPNKDQPVALPA